MEVNRLTDLFWKSHPNGFFLSIILACVVGVGSSMLIPLVLYSFSGVDEIGLSLEVLEYSFFNSPTSKLAELFLVLCIVIIFVQAFSITLSAYIVSKASVLQRLYLYKRIGDLSVFDLQKIGQARLINLLHMDVMTISEAAMCIPQLWVSVLTLVGALGYLLYLDVRVFGFVIVGLFFGVVTYQIPIYFGAKLFHRSRVIYDAVQEGGRGLIYGAKELKLNRAKYEEYYSEVVTKSEYLANAQFVKGRALFIFAESYGGLLSFLVVGVSVFHLRYIFNLSQIELFGIVMALLFLTGPVGVLLNMIGVVKRGQVSLDKIKDFYSELRKEESGYDLITSDWTYIKLKNVEYAYPGSDEAFSIAGIDLEFCSGEITFVIGGNGSGKSTLAKLLSLHATPTSGSIYLGNKEVTGSNLGSARQFISAIYLDFFLFSDLYGCKVEQSVINKYLIDLELDSKVSLIDGKLSTINLSDGQRKRLALLVLLLEDRKVCVFDEWAADQDPRFKNIFYSKILPDLKSQGKIVIVISHDDRYFDYADKIVEMENGRVVSPGEK